jgi:hypothetical protein
MQAGYGWLVHDPMASGTGSVMWHCMHGMPAWFPESMGKQAPCPEKVAGLQRQNPWQPMQASCGYPGNAEWFTPLADALARSAWWHSQQGTVGRANERSRLSPWHCSQGSSAWRPCSGKLVRRWASASKRDFHPSVSWQEAHWKPA